MEKSFKGFLLLFLLYFLSSLYALGQNTNVTLRSQFTYTGTSTGANIWGYVDSVGNEYALVCRSNGLSIVDVTNPNTPVSVAFIPGNSSQYREVQVKDKYAYVVTEGGGGLQIINLSTLPNSSGITYHYYTGDGPISFLLNTAHTLFIEGNYLYINGTFGLFNGGTGCFNITDPWNPSYLGNYSVGTGNQIYVHDGYVRNDTLYAAHINSGYFSVVDFTNKANPIEIVNHNTPSNNTHNTWLSTDGKTLFTTDEVSGGYLTAYDISNLSNITEVDKIRSNPGFGSYVHNTHIINKGGNDYAITSWYCDGFTIVDAGRPENLVQIGNYDTYTGTNNTLNGTWGVYPYLPSGNIIVSNISEGLFVFTPNYVRASYLEGTITDSITGQPINTAVVKILNSNIKDSTDLNGNYEIGTSIPGVYDIKISKTGYYDKIISGIILTSGNLVVQDIELIPLIPLMLTGQVIDGATSLPVANAHVSLKNDQFEFQTTTNSLGNFTVFGYQDNYSILSSKWGYKMTSNQNINLTSSPISISLNKGYYDDFTFDLGWTVSSTANKGKWERAIPLGSYNTSSFMCSPNFDDTTDFGIKAYTTENSTNIVNYQNVDNGYTKLTSPTFDLTLFNNPFLEYTRWFYANGAMPNDSLIIFLDNGSMSVLIDIDTNSSSTNAMLINKSIRIQDFITPTSTMKVIIYVVDNNPTNTIVESLFDKFHILEGPTSINESTKFNNGVIIYPNPNEGVFNFSNMNKNSIINIFDINGELIYKKETAENFQRVDLSNKSKGLYFYQIINNNNINSGKIILQ
jgi:choice-of-anchor B domain-containing protein